MATEAERRAKAKYRRGMLDSGRLKRIIIDFYPSDHDVYEFLQTKKPVSTYIKELVRKEMQ